MEPVLPGTADPDNWVCGIDRVCTHPDFQQLGLGKTDGLETDDTGHEITYNTIVAATTAAIDVTGTGSGVTIAGNSLGVTADGTAVANDVGVRLEGAVSPQVSNNLIASSTTAGMEVVDTQPSPLDPPATVLSATPPVSTTRLG